MFFLVKSEILLLFVNTLTTDIRCSILNREILQQPIQTQLSKKEKAFSQFFAGFVKSTSKIEHFEKKYESHSLCISEIRNWERND